MTRSDAPSRTRPTRAETRQRILDAAAEEFGQAGYDATSLDAIAKSAGLTKGAIYSSFGSKDDLFAALMTSQIEERLRRVDSAIAERTSTPAASTGRALTESTLGDPEWHVAFIEFWTRAMRNPALRTSFVTHRRAARALIAEHLEQQAAASGTPLPMPAPRLATTLLALSNGLAVEQLLDEEEHDDELLSDLLTLLFTPPQAAD